MTSGEKIVHQRLLGRAFLRSKRHFHAIARGENHPFQKARPPLQRLKRRWNGRRVEGE